jgi:serine/threonine-protein kinase
VPAGGQLLEGELPEGELPDGEWDIQLSRRTGALLGERYRVCGFVAEGATARIYLAVDTEAGGAVAIKQLKPNEALHPEFRKRFLQEGRTAMAIDHPNVVKVLAVSEPDAEAPYIVMEALNGEPLGAVLRREPLMPAERALELSLQIAAGLEASHRCNVIHRDVKPDNVFLVGPKGAPERVKIVDFGMAKRLTTISPSSDDLVLGTAAYMAPEQVVADPVDPRTDVYAFGVLMFRLFTGHLPFDLDLSPDLFKHQLFSPAPPASWLNEEIDARLDGVISRAMRKHPDNRYLTIAELERDLEVVMGLRDGTVESPPLVVTPDRYEPKNPAGRRAAVALSRGFRSHLPASEGAAPKPDRPGAPDGS